MKSLSLFTTNPRVSDLGTPENRNPQKIQKIWIIFSPQIWRLSEETTGKAHCSRRVGVNNVWRLRTSCERSIPSVRALAGPEFIAKLRKSIATLFEQKRAGAISYRGMFAVPFRWYFQDNEWAPVGELGWLQRTLSGQNTLRGSGRFRAVAIVVVIVAGRVMAI